MTPSYDSHSFINIWRNNFEHAPDKFVVDTCNPGHNILAIYLISVQLILHE